MKTFIWGGLWALFLVFDVSAARAQTSGEWEVYLTERGDTAIATVVDLSLKEQAPVSTFPFLLTISLPLQSPMPNGLTSSEEGPQIEKIQNKITQLLCSDNSTAPVGIRTEKGWRTLYLYSKRPKIDTSLLNTVFIFNPAFKAYKYQIMRDSAWSVYLGNLYPAPREMVKIQNTRQIKALVLNGDMLSLDRPVEHFVAFALEKSAKAFLKKIKREHYTLLDLTQDTLKAPSAMLPWVLHIGRQDGVGPKIIDANSLYLFDMALANRGQYLGWQTTVKKIGAPTVPR